MYENFGKVYKEIRKSKGVTQADICSHHVARSTLARIESGDVIPRFDTMIFFLHQIDMTFEEFKYIYNRYQPSKRQKIINLANNQNFVTTSTDELIRLKQLCENYLCEESDIPITHILYQLKITLHVRKYGGYSQDEEFQQITQTIWSYLEKQDTWYLSDLHLLRTILYHFPIETIQEFTQKILDSLANYKDFYDIKPAKLALLTNLATIFLYNDLKGDCKKVTLMALETAKELKRYDYLGLSQVRLGICYGDDDLIDKGMALLRLTEETQMLETLEEELKAYR